MTDAPPLWHFTSEAAARRIDAGGGWLLPAAVLLPRKGWPAAFQEGSRHVWLTDQASPTARLLGFRTSTAHMAARYRVAHPEVATWWPLVRREHSRAYLETLEAHAMPTLWWVADEPVRVVRDRTWSDPLAMLVRR